MKGQLQLHIPAPCHENWNNMTATQQGKFCMSCQKEVIDFSVMSDKEIIAYIAGAASNICGRVQEDQLNRKLINPREPHNIWWRHWVNIAASFLLLSSKSNAQVQKNNTPVVAVQPDTVFQLSVGKIGYQPNKSKNKTAIRGRVTDDNDNPVAYATIQIKDSKAGVAADDAGYFLISPKMHTAIITLLVSAVGYESTSIEINIAANYSGTTEIKKIVLKKKSMKNVEVVAGICGRRTGGLLVCRYTRYTTVKTTVKDMLGINEIKVYPNPIAVNRAFKISFNVKEQGAYSLQFTDASGRIIAARQLNIVFKDQLENFSGNMFSSGGIYFASITGGRNAKRYTTKLLVQ